MNYYKLKVQYDGTNYAGFQYQKDAPTIQAEINRALSEIFDGKISTKGSSRTDTGVHARTQWVKITLDSVIDEEHFLEKINTLLPKDIRCLEIFKSNFEYNPILNVAMKEYRYFFTNIKNPQNLNRRFIANISNELDFDLMKAGLVKIKGTHDFKNFTSTGSNVESTIRTIFKAELSLVNLSQVFEKDSLFYSNEDCYQLIFEGDGFLKQMIRHLVSGLWSVGTKKFTLDEFEEVLSGEKLVKNSWKVAPPNGLILYKID